MESFWPVVGTWGDLGRASHWNIQILILWKFGESWKFDGDEFVNGFECADFDGHFCSLKLAQQVAEMVVLAMDWSAKRKRKEVVD